MKTAAHSTFTGPGRIVISLGSPRGAPAGYKIFRGLAPTRDILNQANNKALYERRFRAEVLGILDPRATWDKLHQLANGAEPVLQCFERPPFTACNWCHRRMVADWFLETLGERVDELDPETPADRERNRALKHQASSPASAPGGTLAMSAAPLRATVEAVRAEIDRWWVPVLARLGEQRFWSWMGLPDRIRALLSVGEQVEWDELQERYRWADVAA